MNKVEIVDIGIPYTKDCIFRINGKLVWIDKRDEMVLTEPIKANITINNAPFPKFNRFDAGIFIGNYKEVELRDEHYFAMYHEYHVVGSLIIEYYNEWLMHNDVTRKEVEVKK